MNWGELAEGAWVLRRAASDLEEVGELLEEMDVATAGRPGDQLYVRAHHSGEETTIYALIQRIGRTGPRIFVEQVDESEPMSESKLRHYWDHVVAEEFVSQVRYWSEYR